MCRMSRRWRLLALFGVLTAPMAVSAVNAQVGDPSATVEAMLVRQDSSDCGNSDVRADDPSRIGGTVLITRVSGGQYRAKVAITATPNTVYHFFLKCVKQLGDIKTEDEGEAIAEFEFEAASAPTFDMYPEGAPAGNKFQSTPVKLP